MSFRILFLTLILSLGGVAATLAQNDPKFPGNIRNDRHERNSPGDGLEKEQREMLKEMELKREASDYKEHVARARETAQLALELKDAYTRGNILEAAHVKKLGRIEKLARQIRNKAGGEETKDELKDPPQQLQAALERLTELSAELQKKVESTPRQVVSAAVIKRANEIVELVRYIRTL